MFIVISTQHHSDESYITTTEYYGPFESKQDAEEWGDNNVHATAVWLVVELYGVGEKESGALGLGKRRA